MVDRSRRWSIAEARTASVVRHRASRVAGSAELSARARAQLRLQRAGRCAQQRHQRAERRLARASGASAAGVADQRSARDDGGPGRAQRAAGPARRRGPRRVAVCVSVPRVGDPRERRLGRHRCHRLAAHPRRGPPGGAGARRREPGRDRAVRGVLVGPSPRSPPPRHRAHRARLRHHRRPAATWAGPWSSSPVSESTSPGRGCAPRTGRRCCPRAR